MRMRRRKPRRDLRRDRKQRIAVKVTVCNRKQEVGGTRAERRYHNSNRSRQPAVYSGRYAGVCFVAEKCEIDAPAAKGIHEHQDLAARQTEHTGDARRSQFVGDNVGD